MAISCLVCTKILVVEFDHPEPIHHQHLHKKPHIDTKFGISCALPPNFILFLINFFWTKGQNVIVKFLSSKEEISQLRIKPHTHYCGLSLELTVAATFTKSIIFLSSELHCVFFFPFLRQKADMLAPKHMRQLTT